MIEPNKDTIDRRRFLEIIGLGAGVGIASGSTGATVGSGQRDAVTAGKSQQTTTAAEDRHGGDLVIRERETIQALNPYMTIRASMSRLASKLYSTLVKTDADLNLHPDLATDWEANDNVDVWTFTLRDNATFNHNGKQVTAADVKATFDKVYDEDTGSPGQGALGPIDTVNAVDTTTVEFELERPTADFPRFLIKSYGSIAPKEIMENDFKSLETTVYGSGPFVLDEFASNEFIQMSAADDYYRTDEQGNQLPYVDTLQTNIVAEETTAVNMLDNREVDIIQNLGIPQFARVANNDQLSALEVPTGTFAGVVLRAKNEPFDDWRVRKAFKLAVNYEPIVKNIMEGHGTVGQDSIISPVYDWYTDLDRQQDVEQARSLLDEVGLLGADFGEEFGITFWSSNEQTYRVPMGLTIKQQLEENLDITLPFQEITHETYINDHWGQSAMATIVYEMRISVDDFLRLLIWSEGPWHTENAWDNDRMDELILEAGATLDDTKRQKLYDEIQQLMMDRGPHMVVMYENRLGAAGNWVNNYEILPLTLRLWAEEIWLDTEMR
ncbi:ABC transporter substrate-binding protein [Halorussus salinisoli]|uniref:ABC transporter substrate-binding protein n=1 Tax=Halorussus salinisoli TaxID=2558242 RepID=UPI0010C1F9DF|nr:ABC transporter substrate-binding protein [Halorussus salinisoli]